MNNIPQVQSYTCPCCGGFIGEAAPLSEIIHSMPEGVRKELLKILSRVPGSTFTQDRLMGLVYADRADGGPDAAQSAFSVYMHRLRKTLAPFGWTIVCTGRSSGDSGHGGTYKLIPTEARH